jgi:mono/diheme cytochrome c family protein
VIRKLLKVLAVLLGVVVLLIGAAWAYVTLTWQRDYSATPLPAVTASADPAVIARGEYIVHSVAHCSACHMFTAKPVGPIDWNQPLSGGYTWDIPLFGHFVAANITPDTETGIGSLSDGQIARAVRSAVDRNGRIMPFMLFGLGPISDEDLTAVVSYLRSRPPVRRAHGAESWGIMAKALSGNFTPRANPVPPASAAGPSVERGRYLAEGPAACRQCHTSMDPMTFAFNNAPFAGNSTAEADADNEGYEFVTPNLTPDPETGHITAWDEDTFLRRFRAGRVYSGSVMPWENFGRMTDDDIRSLYRFLKTLPPTRHLIGPAHRKVGDAPKGA